MRSGGKTGPPSFRKNLAKSLASAPHPSAGGEGSNVPRAVPPPTPTSLPSPELHLRHIHPCICDLTDESRKKIVEHHRKKNAEQTKLLRRIKEIEEELARMEELYNLRSTEHSDMQEFYGDEYELIHGKKKRKKRSARRASMVSLGVKQRIKWWKEPEIAVIYNQTFKLRQENNTYCARHSYDLPPPRTINYVKRPLIPVRVTRASAGRTEINLEKKERLIELDDPRPLFVSAFSC